MLPVTMNWNHAEMLSLISDQVSKSETFMSSHDFLEVASPSKFGLVYISLVLFLPVMHIPLCLGK